MFLQYLASHGAARKQFAREAKAAAAILHPNVMAIHSVSNDKRSPYLVMPYVRGKPLQKPIDDAGPLPWSKFPACDSARQAGSLPNGRKPWASVDDLPEQLDESPLPEPVE